MADPRAQECKAVHKNAGGQECGRTRMRVHKNAQECICTRMHNRNHIPAPKMDLLYF